MFKEFPFPEGIRTIGIVRVAMDPSLDSLSLLPGKLVPLPFSPSRSFYLALLRGGGPAVVALKTLY